MADFQPAPSFWSTSEIEKQLEKENIKCLKTLITPVIKSIWIVLITSDVINTRHLVLITPDVIKLSLNNQ